MNTLSYIAAGIMAVLGIMHFGYTFADFLRAPKYFSPVDQNLLQAMQRTKTSIAPQGRDYWSGVLGFNFSHSLGLIIFAVLIVIVSQNGLHSFEPILVGIALIYTTISWRCWFALPTLLALLSSALLFVDWLF